MLANVGNDPFIGDIQKIKGEEHQRLINSPTTRTAALKVEAQQKEIEELKKTVEELKKK